MLATASRNSMRRALGGQFQRHMRATAAPLSDDVALLQKLLSAAQEREAAAKAAPAAAEGDSDPSKKFQIQGFNAISQIGLDRFPSGEFMLTGSAGQVPPGCPEEPHAIVLQAALLKRRPSLFPEPATGRRLRSA